MHSVLLGLLLLSPGEGQLAQTPTFSAAIELVRVDVLVTKDGRPVRGLRASDFELTDNGVGQQVDLAGLEPLPVNVVLALDVSESVAGERLAHLRAAGIAALEALRKDDRAALITFSDLVRVESGLTGDLATVQSALERLRVRGGTALVDAAYAGLVFGESETGRALLIVFTDGVDTSSWLAPDAVLDAARWTDVVVYAVSAGTGQEPRFLRELGRTTGGDSLHVESTKDLPEVFHSVLEEFRQRYTLSYSPRGVGRQGWHRIVVRVRRQGVTVKARSGYYVGK